MSFLISIFPSMKWGGYMRLGLLNLTTTDILDQAILQMFSSIPGIYPLDASNTPTHTLVVTIKYNSRHCQMSPGGGGAKSPQLRATELDLESEMPTIISCYTNERRSDERKANSRAYVLSKKEDNPHLQWTLTICYNCSRESMNPMIL